MPPAVIVSHLVIAGRVQGVGFRYHLRRVARESGVTGWVRNRRDGSVEATLAGTPDAVEKVIAWARHGPGGARVDRVEIAQGAGRYDGFETLPTE